MKLHWNQRSHLFSTNREYREMFNIKNRMALIDLSGLCEKQILTRVGKTGRGTEYILIGQTRNKPEIRIVGGEHASNRIP
jgi:predicted HTH transcriptional regulator